MHINCLTVNKLDEEKILSILQITKMPMENERTPTSPPPAPPSQHFLFNSIRTGDKSWALFNY